MRLFAWLCVGAALTWVGCAGVRDETPAELEPVASPLLDDELVLVGGHICEQMSSVAELPLSAANSLGFRGTDVLAFAGGTHQTSVHWSDGLAQESGARALKVMIQPRTSNLRLIDPSLGVIGHGLICETWLEIDVSVTLQSDRGALNERFDATLYTREPGAAYLSLTSVGVPLGGGLLQLGSQGNASDHRFALQLRVSKVGVSGELIGVTHSYVRCSAVCQMLRRNLLTYVQGRASGRARSRYRQPAICGRQAPWNGGRHENRRRLRPVPEPRALHGGGPRVVRNSG